MGDYGDFKENSVFEEEDKRRSLLDVAKVNTGKVSFIEASLVQESRSTTWDLRCEE